MSSRVVNKKRLRWTLALMTIFAIVGTGVLRHQVQKRKAGIAAQAARKQKEKSEHNERPVPVRPPPPKKGPKTTVLSPEAMESLAESDFIAALRSVLVWRNTQQAGSPETSRVLIEKLSAISCDSLSPECKGAWQSLLQSLKSPGDQKLQAQGRQASGVLNAMLKAHGDGDIVL